MQVIQTFDKKVALYWFVFNDEGVDLVTASINEATDSKQEFEGPYFSKGEALENLHAVLAKKK